MESKKNLFLIIFAVVIVISLSLLFFKMSGIFSIGDISQMYAPHTTEGALFNASFAGYNVVYEHCGNQYFVRSNGTWVPKTGTVEGGKLRSVKRSGAALNISGITPYHDQILNMRVFPDEPPRCTNIPINFYLLASTITPAAMTHYDYSVLVQPSSNSNGGNRITSEILPHANKDLIEINQSLTASGGYKLVFDNKDKAYRARTETVFTTTGGGTEMRSKQFSLGLGKAMFSINSSGLTPEKALTSVFLEMQGNNESWYNIETINLPEKLKSNLTSTTAATTTTVRAGNSTNATTTTTLNGDQVTISAVPWYYHVGGLLLAGLVVAGFWFAISKMGRKR